MFQYSLSDINYPSLAKTCLKSLVLAQNTPTKRSHLDHLPQTIAVYLAIYRVSV